MNQVTLREIRRRLHAKRSQVLVRYKSAVDRADEEQGASTELVDAANDQWDIRVLSAMSETDVAALEAIVAALDRLDTGRYGVCPACGKRIAPARLQIMPEAVECAACAAFAEEQPPRWISEVS